MSLVALLLAWVYIFDTVQRERELLEGPKEGIVGAAGLQDPSQVAHTTTVFPPDRKDSSKGTDVESGEMAGQSVSLPPQMVLEAAEGRNVGDMYAPMQGRQNCFGDMLVCWTAVVECTVCSFANTFHDSLHCFVVAFYSSYLSVSCMLVIASYVMDTGSWQQSCCSDASSSTPPQGMTG